MVAWAIVSEETVGVEEGRMLEEIKRTLRSWDCVRPFVQTWPLGFNDNSNTEPREVILSVARDWGRPSTRALIAQVRPRVQDMLRSRRAEISGDGIEILGLLLQSE